MKQKARLWFHLLLFTFPDRKTTNFEPSGSICSTNLFLSLFIHEENFDLLRGIYKYC